jgi:hypothetical protein
MYAPFATGCGYCLATVGADDEAIAIVVGQLYVGKFAFGW